MNVLMLKSVGRTHQVVLQRNGYVKNMRETEMKGKLLASLSGIQLAAGSSAPLLGVSDREFVANQSRAERQKTLQLLASGKEARML